LEKFAAKARQYWIAAFFTKILTAFFRFNVPFEGKKDEEGTEILAIPNQIFERAENKAGPNSLLDS